MTDTAIFIFGMFVFAVCIGAALIAMIGSSASTLKSSKQREVPRPPEA